MIGSTKQDQSNYFNHFNYFNKKLTRTKAKQVFNKIICIIKNAQRSITRWNEIWQNRFGGSNTDPGNCETKN